MPVTARGGARGGGPPPRLGEAGWAGAAYPQGRGRAAGTRGCVRGAARSRGRKGRGAVGGGGVGGGDGGGGSTHGGGRQIVGGPRPLVRRRGEGDPGPGGAQGRDPQGGLRGGGRRLAEALRRAARAG